MPLNVLFCCATPPKPDPTAAKEIVLPSPPSHSTANMTSTVTTKLRDISVEAKCIAEYIWMDAKGKLRSKARTLSKPPTSVDELPRWNYDGSSTDQAPGEDSEVIIYPQAFYPDPFRGAPHILVMTDTYTPKGEPLPTNSRFECAKAMKEAESLEPWFGLEQEYFMIDAKTDRPLGWPADSEPEAQGKYYCGVGPGLVGRSIVDAHYKACVYAGLKISGINAEVAPAQWEFQIGPAIGIEMGDMLMVGRYMLERIAEEEGVEINYDPKPIKGDWNGSGCHSNFSTKPMREEGGYEAAIVPALEKLGLKHKEHIEAYGEGNADRLTGKHETADINTWKWGVADRGASCRVGNDTKEEGKGYFEDRRPAGNCDPYVVTRMLVQTCCLE